MKNRRELYAEVRMSSHERFKGFDDLKFFFEIKYVLQFQHSGTTTLFQSSEHNNSEVPSIAITKVTFHTQKI